VSRDRWPDDVEHVWTHDDRLAQLTAMEPVCRRMADLFATHRDSSAAELVSARAEAAARLLRDGFSQADLDEAFGGGFPAPASWLQPKSYDFHARRQAWQDEAAELFERAAALASDLHSVATLRGP
jgi:hypothetical protein